MRRTAIAILAWMPLQVFAGMPVFRLNEVVQFRIQALSFFIFAFAVCAFLVKVLWNYLQKDFSSLPRLSYPKAAALTFMIGLLFMCVLTMISGARELMTPGAWQKDGATYKLQNADAPDSEAQRRARLERLWLALSGYAKSHAGRFPLHEFVPEVPASLWTARTDGARYIYLAGWDDKNPEPRILAYEPGGKSDERLVLMTDGQIVTMNHSNIQQRLTAALAHADNK